MEKNKKYFTIVELDPNNDSQLRIKLCEEKTNYEEFKDLYDYCFLPKDSYMILIWKNDNEMEKVIQAFDKRTQELCLFDMRKSVFKYLLYKYGNSNAYIWRKLQEELENNYYFILVIEELIAKIPNRNDNIIKSCFELVYNLFMKENFNISTKNKKNEPDNVNLPDITTLFQKYIYILLVKYSQDNTPVPVVPPIAINSKSLFEVTAKHLISLESFPKKITQDIYLLSLEKNIPFICYFKTSPKYKDKWEKVISSYKEYYPHVNENEMSVILDDLFANQIILSKNVAQNRFLRYPLWLIIVLNYQGNSLNKECGNYLSLLQKQESQQNNPNNLVQFSLLNQGWVFPENLKCNELVDYFKTDEKTKLIKLTLTKGKNHNRLETFLNELIKESNADRKFSSIKFEENDKKLIDSWKELILKHVENNIESLFKQRLKEIKQAGKTIKDEKEICEFFDESIKQELLATFTFLKNIEQISNGEQIKKELEFDLYKEHSIVIEHDKTDIYQQIYDNIENKKKCPLF